MFCKNCGKELDDRAVVCPNCGVPTDEKAFSHNAVKENDAPSAGFAVLCFFIPILGLILYLVWKDEYPLKAKSCGKGALISVIVYVALFVFYFVFYIIFFMIILSAGACAVTMAACL